MPGGVVVLVESVKRYNHYTTADIIVSGGIIIIIIVCEVFVSFRLLSLDRLLAG